MAKKRQRSRQGRFSDYDDGPTIEIPFETMRQLVYLIDAIEADGKASRRRRKR